MVVRPAPLPRRAGRHGDDGVHTGMVAAGHQLDTDGPRRSASHPGRLWPSHIRISFLIHHLTDVNRTLSSEIRQVLDNGPLHLGVSLC